jgi:hypothetical protein
MGAHGDLSAELPDEEVPLLQVRLKTTYIIQGSKRIFTPFIHPFFGHRPKNNYFTYGTDGIK